MDAPEKIVASVDYESINGKRLRYVAVGTDGPPHPFDPTHYTRSDLCLELVAAAYEAAANVVSRAGHSLDAEIRSLTPADAQAALAARDARIREAALREAAEVCLAAKDRRNKQRHDYPEESPDVQQRWMAGALQSQYNADAILALISKDKDNGQ